MSTTLFLALVIAAPPQSAHISDQAPVAIKPSTACETIDIDKPQPVERTVKQIRAAVSQTLRREALSQDAVEREQAVLDLVELAVEVRNHPKLDNSVGKGMTSRIRNRLRRVAQEMKRTIKRDLTKREAQRRQPANVKLANPGDDVQAQLGIGAGGNQNGLNQPADMPQLLGDNGEDLVELIEQVIAPASWEINGGNGVIVYYKPLRVLVVRQRGEVHDDLAELIEGLNRN